MMAFLYCVEFVKNSNRVFPILALKLGEFF